MAAPAPYLVEEILEEILIRVPTSAALARASTACASFRRIITARPFLRRYRKLHPPPLLGFAGENGGFDPVQEPHPSAPLARALADAADFSYSYVPKPDESVTLCTPPGLPATCATAASSSCAIAGFAGQRGPSSEKSSRFAIPCHGVFGSFNKNIKQLKERLEDLQKRDFLGNQEEIRNVSFQLDELLLREEVMWKQRSRIRWLREGDKNTKFFHRKASARRKKNRILRLKRPYESFAIDEEEILSRTQCFFENLYSKDQETDPESLLQFVEPMVTEDMNRQLTADFSDEEIGDALFQIGPLKAPGLDGLPARFFQRNWALLKAETCSAIKKFFQDDVLPKGINMTKIVLIPKSNEVEDLKEFKPISLCNVIYKIIVKCLVNRLGPYLQRLIDETQSAFIPERLISDNALIAFECFHAI
ncbi:hypothetical protein ACQ4PT_043311 [Festuca glaucescens]